MEGMRCEEFKGTQTSTAAADSCGFNSSTGGQKLKTKCQSASCPKHHQSAETNNHLPSAPDLWDSSFEVMTESAATTNAIHAETSKQELQFQVQASLEHSHFKVLSNESQLHVHSALPDVRGSSMDGIRCPAPQNIRRKVESTCMASQTLHMSGLQILGMETHSHSNALSQTIFVKPNLQDVSQLQFSASAAVSMIAAPAATLCLSQHRDSPGISAALASPTDVKTNLSSLFSGMWWIVVCNFFEFW